jgi:hypothetical protein
MNGENSVSGSPISIDTLSTPPTLDGEGRRDHRRAIWAILIAVVVLSISAGLFLGTRSSPEDLRSVGDAGFEQNPSGGKEIPASTAPTSTRPVVSEPLEPTPTTMPAENPGSTLYPRPTLAPPSEQVAPPKLPARPATPPGKELLSWSFNPTIELSKATSSLSIAVEAGCLPAEKVEVDVQEVEGGIAITVFGVKGTKGASTPCLSTLQTIDLPSPIGDRWVFDLSTAEARFNPAYFDH